MRSKTRCMLAAVLATLCASPSAVTAGNEGEHVVIYVAASTKDAVDQIARAFTAETGLAVEVSPGASSKLAKQIVEGGPADIFLCADQANADVVEKQGFVARRRNLLGNRLVVVVPADATTSMRTLADLADDDVRKLALAIDGVPAGVYAREALRKAGVWERVESKIIGGEDVRATLAFVEQGADAGIVYLTDAVGSSKVRVALEIDAGLHRPIEYPVVLTMRGVNHDGAVRLFDRLFSEGAAEVFRNVQFQVLK